MQEDPLRPLGLQAYEMRLLDAGELESLQQLAQQQQAQSQEDAGKDVLVLKAGIPWWRREEGCQG
jgi:hypothetical protein